MDVRLPRGVFTLSLDFELIWGTLDLQGLDGFRRDCEQERAVVVDRLLALLERYEISATWCVVGHLFLDRCTGHPEIVPPQHAWVRDGWFARDPGGTEAEQPLFLGRSLVRRIRACPVPQEVGSHSFSHIIFGDEGCSREAAQSDLDACLRAAAAEGVALRSFAFPRNRVGHLDVLRDRGFVCYRGPEPTWYERDGEGRSLSRRLAHLLDVLRAATPPVVLPERHESGLWNIPGSMIYFPKHGFRRFVPDALRVRRAFRGLDAAARERRVFHLWFHPTNLAVHTDSMFRGLERILARAAELRAQGRLEVRPMGDLVPHDPTLAGAA